MPNDTITQNIVLGTGEVGEPSAGFRLEVVSPYAGTVSALAFDDNLCESHAAMATLTVNGSDPWREVAVSAIDGPTAGVEVQRGDRLMLRVALADQAKGITCIRLGETKVALLVASAHPAGRVVLGAGRIGEGQSEGHLLLVAPADGHVIVETTERGLCPSHAAVASVAVGGHRQQADLGRVDASILGCEVHAGDRVVVDAELVNLNNGIMCVRFGWHAFEVVLR